MGKYILKVDGQAVSEDRGINLVAGDNITLTVTETPTGLPVVEITSSGGVGGGAPADADYLVGTANGDLSGEIVVGTTPGGELGGTWASPTVDATHAGSTHSAATDTHIADATAAHAASAISIADAGNDFTATDVEGALDELQADAEAHVAAGDPHTGYRLESADHSHQSTGAQAGQLDHGAALTGLTDDDHTIYLKEKASGGTATEVPTHNHSAAGEAGTIDHGAITGLTDDDHTIYRKESDPVHLVTFSKEGNLSTGTGTIRWYNDTGASITLDSARGSVGTAPASQSILIDVNNNGTSVWNSNQGNRITIAASTNTDEGGAFDDATIADGEYITVDIDQVGSGTVGADLSVSIWGHWSN